jgi:hypothetical protein
MGDVALERQQTFDFGSVIMSSTHTAAVEKGQRNDFGLSQNSRTEARRDALIRDAFLRIVSAFKRRPGSAWNRAADGTETRWNKLMNPIRAAIDDAVREGNPIKIVKTVEASDEFFDALKADIHSRVPSGEEESIIALAIREAEASSKAKVETLRLVAHPSPTEAEHALEPLAREESTLVRLIDRCQRFARQSPVRVLG